MKFHEGFLESLVVVVVQKRFPRFRKKDNREKDGLGEMTNVMGYKYASRIIRKGKCENDVP